MVQSGSYTSRPLAHSYGSKGVHAGSMVPGEISWAPSSSSTPRSGGWTASGSVGIDTAPNTGQYWNYMTQYSTSEWRFTNHAVGAIVWSPRFRIPTNWLHDMGAVGSNDLSFKFGGWVGAEGSGTLRLRLERSANPDGSGGTTSHQTGTYVLNSQHGWLGSSSTYSAQSLVDRPYFRLGLEKTAGNTGHTYASSMFFFPEPTSYYSYQCYVTSIEGSGGSLYVVDPGQGWARGEPFPLYQSTDTSTDWIKGPYFQGGTSNYNTSSPLTSMARIEVNPWQLIAVNASTTVAVLTIARNRGSGY